jgi:sialidase-1
MRLALIALFTYCTLSAQAPEKQVLFEGRALGYAGFRIPALVSTAKGTLLAFCAARKGLGDWDDIDIMLRRSTDRGRTWEPARVIAERGAMTVDNATPIVDRVTGAVHFLFQVNYAQLMYMRSDDDGRTFSTPVDITEVVHGFRGSGGARQRYGWTVVAPGPGHSIQLASGRLLVTVWLSPHHSHRPSAIATIYSDDHGKTWQRGEVVGGGLQNPSEHMAVELADGSVILSIRSEGAEHLRAVAASKDGISGWSRPALHPDLFEPVCMASILRLSRAPERKNRLLFSNPDSRSVSGVMQAKYNMRSRDNLTVKLSYDEGKTWPVAKLLQSGATGYSDIAAAPDGAIYILYEQVDNATSNEGTWWKDGQRNLMFARFTLEWLTDGKDAWEKR